MKRYNTKKDIKVKYLWWYDTIAILPEYDDTEIGILPKDELVEISGDEYEDGYIVLNLMNHKKLKKTQISKGRISEVFLFCKATPLQALVTPEELENYFEKIG